ncbi:MAG: hypothetical protein US86_C0004G0018 [Candidatus Daviesbacteria bacterium GW2011_GWA2_38_24]|uniref:Uncharacterized protein n=1 Tax=Candidatus Daviesbacteria bacterium GW2011_GWA2_38_24 TaxID=1618422 RepID=A0A0G0JUJ0_9BACT|nr:MAG: hypothetical protein US86_C0004G0018 [Candidatus Daviesbacteria bacterium GW2011_GWA2_38_24]OGE23464.1 MAG: hypothetical protein A2688_00085 [Candidatus Daviesbacteria bacterium RIFCSPHIGHO2_01_FULL_38_8]
MSRIKKPEKQIRNKNTVCQVDQSGKIEQTNKITIIAFSNGKHGSVKLKASDKRYLQDIYRQAGKSKSFTLQVFSALLYLLFEKFKLEKTMVFIDKEYPGHEPLIRSYLVQLASKRGKIELTPEDLRFGLVGKGSNAHGVSSKAFKANRADFSIAKEEILSLILLYEH